MKPSILIIEDETSMADILADNLSEEGYEVAVAQDGQTGLDMWQHSRPQLVVLDVMLPQLNGFELCHKMRTAGDDTPVLFLSAKSEPEDRVQGLRVGGDDYLPKPFHLPEFLLRVKNMLKRSRWSGVTGPAETNIFFGGHSVDLRSWTANLANGKQELLGEREFKIFRLLSERSGQVVSRDDILDEVWSDDAFPSSRTVDNFVLRLRKLFEPDPSLPIFFHTVWGVGYKFTPEGQAEEVKS